MTSENLSLIRKPIQSSAANFLSFLDNETSNALTNRFPPEFYVAYLNTPIVQSAIGAFQNYTEYSAAVGDAFNTTGDDGREDGTVADMLELLEQGITVRLPTSIYQPSLTPSRS